MMSTNLHMISKTLGPIFHKSITGMDRFPLSLQMLQKSNYVEVLPLNHLHVTICTKLWDY
jgi:hypothetical protein